MNSVDTILNSVAEFVSSTKKRQSRDRHIIKLVELALNVLTVIIYERSKEDKNWLESPIVKAYWEIEDFRRKIIKESNGHFSTLKDFAALDEMYAKDTKFRQQVEEAYYSNLEYFKDITALAQKEAKQKHVSKEPHRVINLKDFRELEQEFTANRLK